MAGKKKKKAEVLQIGGREVRISSPDKVYFKAAGADGATAITKLELVRYYLAMGAGALRGVRDRPVVLKRFVKGIGKEAFFQKRAPDSRPEWVQTCVLRYGSGRSAEEAVIDDMAALAWTVQLGCIDLNAHAVRSADLHHPDELRVDLDPGPGVVWDDVRKVALEVQDVLTEHGLIGWPKTSGSRGLHIFARIEPEWTFAEVRRAAVALARDIEQRAPSIATARWWKEERHGVFVDYNQNAKDKTMATVYSVRPLPDARVSAPMHWDEVAACVPEDFTLLTMPARLADVGDSEAGMDAPEVVGRLDSLLELHARQEAEGAAEVPTEEGARGATATAETKTTKGKRTPKFPLLTIANAEHKPDALAGLERWKARHPEAAVHLAVDDILVDRMRGRSSLWTRIRVNLRHVPQDQRPAAEPPDPDYDPWAKWRVQGRPTGSVDETNQTKGGA